MNAKIDISSIILTTKRLKLRPFAPFDIDDLYEYSKVDGVGQSAGWLPHKSKQESAVILQWFIDGKSTFALEYDGKVIGSLGIDTYDEKQLAEFTDKQGREIGYVLSKDYWGKGLMTEAVQAVVRYCFDVLKLDFLVCGHFTENLRSQRVQEKCGFVHYKQIVCTTNYGEEKTEWISVLKRIDCQVK